MIFNDIKQNILNLIDNKDIQNPTAISYNPTDRCQSRCKTCNCWQIPASCMEKELSTEEWKNFLTNMHNWLGNYNFIISGGEPFLRNDIIEIINFAGNLGDIVNIITNGLSIENKIDEIINSKLNNISFSLNSIKDSSIHNNSRGRDDAFNLTMNALLKLINENNKLEAEKKKDICIASIIMPSNLNEIKEMILFCKEKNITICFQLLDNGESFKTNLDKDISIYKKNIQTAVLETLDEIIYLKQNGYPIVNSIEQLSLLKKSIQYPEKMKKYKCSVGETNFSVDPYGNVRICFDKEPVGNIKNTLPQEIWQSKASKKARKVILKCEKSCKLLNCNTKELLD